MKKPEVYKVIGAPGTGKTTRVVGNPSLGIDGLFIEEMDNGYSLSEQMLVTYTNAGVDEAADRLEEMLDVPRSHIDARVTTIHSQCFGTLGLTRYDVADSYDKKDFCDKHDLDFGWDNDEDDIMSNSEDADAGNVLFQIYGWLKSNCKPLSEWQDCPADWIGEDDPEFLMEEWENYKEEEGMHDFTDMIQRVVENGLAQMKDRGWVEGDANIFNAIEKLEEARDYSFRAPSVLRGKGSFVDTKILYVDEVQDLTPLQWRWYLMQKLVCDKVYLGGDDDQSIYGWAGADPEFMLGEEGDFEVLDKTYRIPEQVWEVCDNTISHVDERQEKDVEPHGDDGEVEILTTPTNNELLEHLTQSDDVFVLFRARYMIDEFRETLHEQGIPYRNNSTFDTWDEETRNICNALAKIRTKQDTITHDEFEDLKSNLPSHCVNGKISSSGDIQSVYEKWNGVPVEDVVDVIDLKKSKKVKSTKFTYNNYLDAAMNDRYNEGGGDLNYYAAQAIRGVMQNENWDLNPDDVTLGTIHSAKGKEAKTVVLATDTTQTIAENMVLETKYRPDKKMTDSERRVYYVGMSRASEKLVLVEGMVNTDQYIPTDTLLHGGAKETKQTQLQ